MTDYLAMVLCCGGFGLISIGGRINSALLVTVGFLFSLIGSGLWLAYSFQRKQWAFAVQSLFFAIFAGVGLFR